MQTRGRRDVTCSASGSGLNSSQCLFYLALSRVGDADNPGPACASAKLFETQFDEHFCFAEIKDAGDVVSSASKSVITGKEKAEPIQLPQACPKK